MSAVMIRRVGPPVIRRRWRSGKRWHDTTRVTLTWAGVPTGDDTGRDLLGLGGACDSFHKRDGLPDRGVLPPAVKDDRSSKRERESMTNNQTRLLGTTESRGVGESTAGWTRRLVASLAAGAGDREAGGPAYDDLLMLVQSLAHCTLGGERDDDGHTFHADLATEYETLTTLVGMARDVLRMDDPPMGARPCDCVDCCVTRFGGAR